MSIISYFPFRLVRQVTENGNLAVVQMSINLSVLVSLLAAQPAPDRQTQHSSVRSSLFELFEIPPTDLSSTVLGFWKNFVDTFGIGGKKIYITGVSYAGVSAFPPLPFLNPGYNAPSRYFAPIHSSSKPSLIHNSSNMCHTLRVPCLTAKIPTTSTYKAP